MISLDQGLVLLYSYFQRALRRTNKCGASVAALEQSLKTATAEMHGQVVTLTSNKTRMESDAEVARFVLSETKRVAKSREEAIEERGRSRDAAMQVRVTSVVYRLSSVVCRLSSVIRRLSSVVCMSSKSCVVCIVVSCDRYVF